MDFNSSSSSSTAAIAAVSDFLDDSYRPLPSVYLAFLAIWALSALSWALSSWRTHRHYHYHLNNLQWILSLVPLIKTLQLALAFSFWYSCLNLEVCSLWMSFGVYVTGILFQTAAFVAFLLISHGYCIVCERISLRERRTTAAIGSLLYLTQIGYKAGLPYFTVFLLACYLVSFYIIFRRTSDNLLMLSEQLNFIEDEDVPSMHGAITTKYTMFKRFQGTMQIVAVAYILMNINTEDTPDNYWFRLLVREWVQYCIFLYIGWNFRIPEALMHFSMMPALKSGWEMTIPPVYSVEVNEAEFKDLISQEWHVGVKTSACSSSGEATDPVFVIVQNPRAKHKAAPSHNQHGQVVGIIGSTNGRHHNLEDQV